MQIKDIMTKKVDVVSSKASLADASKMMRQLDVGLLPVEENGVLCGMITDRDIAIRAVADSANPDATRVDHVMTPNVVCCFDTQDLHSAMEIMKDRQVRRLAVLNESKKLAGIVSLGDIALNCSKEDKNGLDDTLKAVSAPEEAAVA